MKVLVLFDSLYGNTEKIARTIGGEFLTSTKVLRVGEAKPTDLAKIDLLIVGSPTHGGRPKPAMQQFLNSIPAGALNEVDVAAFDTRLAEADQVLPLRILMKTIGYAAEKISRMLISKGGHEVVSADGFLVTGSRGPLKPGELDRAIAWTKKIKTRLKN
jgi:flavodoxin I